MRVIAGTAKGRRLSALKGRAMRPTRSQVREALFNIMGSRVEGSRFLDLYAGTGGVGVEALSRGAGEVVFVENHPAAVRLIGKNLSACGFETGYRIVGSDVLVFIAGAGRRIMEAGRKETLQAKSPRGGDSEPVQGRPFERFDILFMDPPYGANLADETLGRSAAAGIIVEGGLMVAEHASSVRLAESYGSAALQDTRRFGDTALSFYIYGGGGSRRNG